MRIPPTLALALSVLFATPSLAQDWLYQQDFEGSLGNEWADTRFETIDGLTTFLGRRGGGERTELRVSTESGVDYVLLFDLYLFDSWDGNNRSHGPDRFTVSANGRRVFDHTIGRNARDQSYPFGPHERAHYGGSRSWDDGIYRSVKVEFTADGSETRVSWQGFGLESPDNESWGIDNVRFVNAAAFAEMTDEYGGQGLLGEWFFEDHSLNMLDNIDWMRTPDHTTVETWINRPASTSAPLPQFQKDLFGIRLSGSIDIPEEGVWQFRLTSDDGSDLHIDRTLVIDNDGLHSMRSRTASVLLSKGRHPITVRVFENYVHLGLILEWRPPSGGSWQVVPESAFTMNTEQPRVVRWREVAPID